MKKTSTKTNSKAAKQDSGQAERLLLIAILFLGVIGLAVTYSSKSTEARMISASTIDTTSSDGKLKGDHMILHLNNRTESTKPPKKSSRF